MRKRRKAVKSVRSAFAMSPLKKQKNKNRLRKGRSGIGSMRFHEFVMKRGKKWPDFGQVGHPSGAGSLGFSESSYHEASKARKEKAERWKRYSEATEARKKRARHILRKRRELRNTPLKVKPHVAPHTRPATYGDVMSGNMPYHKDHADAILWHQSRADHHRLAGNKERANHHANEVRRHISESDDKMVGTPIHDPGITREERIAEAKDERRHEITRGAPSAPPQEPHMETPSKRFRRWAKKKRRPKKLKVDRGPGGTEEREALRSSRRRLRGRSPEEQKQVWAKRRSKGGYKASPARRLLHRKGKEYLAQSEALHGMSVLHGRINSRAGKIAAAENEYHPPGRDKDFPNLRRTRHFPYSEHSDPGRRSSVLPTSPSLKRDTQIGTFFNENHARNFWHYHMLRADGHSHAGAVSHVTGRDHEEMQIHPKHNDMSVRHLHGQLRAGAHGLPYGNNSDLPNSSHHGDGHMNARAGDPGNDRYDMPRDWNRLHPEAPLKTAPKYLPIRTIIARLKRKKPLHGTPAHQNATGKSAESSLYTGHMDHHDWQLHHGKITSEEHPRHQKHTGEQYGINRPGAMWSGHSDAADGWKEKHGEGPRLDNNSPDDLNRRYGTHGEHEYPEDLYGRPSGGSVEPRRLTHEEALREGRETYGSRMLDKSNRRYDPARYQRWVARGDYRLHDNPHGDDGHHYSWYDKPDKHHPSMTDAEIRALAGRTGDLASHPAQPAPGIHRTLSSKEADRLPRHSLHRRRTDATKSHEGGDERSNSMTHELRERMLAHYASGDFGVRDEDKPITHAQGELVRAGRNIVQGYNVHNERAMPLPEHVHYIANSNQTIDQRGWTREERRKWSDHLEKLRNGERSGAHWTPSAGKLVPVGHEDHPGGIGVNEYERHLERERLLKTPFKKTVPARDPRLYSKLGQTEAKGVARMGYDHQAESKVQHIRDPRRRQKELTKHIYDLTPHHLLTRREKIHKRVIGAIQGGKAGPTAEAIYRKGGAQQTKEMTGAPKKKLKYRVLRIKHDGGPYANDVYPDGHYNVHINPPAEKWQELKDRWTKKQIYQMKQDGYDEDDIREHFANLDSVARAFHLPGGAGVCCQG